MGEALSPNSSRRPTPPLLGQADARSLIHKVVGQSALHCFHVDSDSFRASLAVLVGCSVRGAGLMLEDLVACGAAVEVSGRGSHRLYGLPGTEGIRGETTGPRPLGGNFVPLFKNTLF